MAFGDLKVQDLIYEDGSNNEITVVLANLVVRDGSGNLVQADNKKFIAGTGSDLQIYHDGSNSYVNNTGTGYLILQGNGSNDVSIRAVNGESGVVVKPNGGASKVELYYDNAKKLNTEADGITVTGNIGIGGDAPNYQVHATTSMGVGAHGFAQHLSLDNDGIQSLVLGTGYTTLNLNQLGGNVDIANDTSKLRLGTSQDLQIYHSGTNSLIQNSTGYLGIQSDTLYLQDKANGHAYITGVADGAVGLRYDNSEKLTTTSIGITVNGKISPTGNIQMPDSTGIKLGASDDFVLYHYATDNTNRIESLTDCPMLLQYWTGSAYEVMAKLSPNGAVELFHDGSKTFETYTKGSIIRGAAGDDGEIQLYADAGTANADCWRFKASSSSSILDIGNYASGSWKTNLECNGNGNVELYYDGSKKLETNTGGVNVVGALTINGSPLAGGLSSDAQKNTVGGTNAGNSFSGTDANDNTLIGYDAGTGITTGDKNTSLGVRANETGTTGSANTAIGYEALNKLTTGGNNVALGNNAGYELATGGRNVALGAQCLKESTAGTGSVAIGWQAVQENRGSYNVGIGYEALKGTGGVTGGNNVAIGPEAGKAVTSGDQNVMLGRLAGNGVTTGAHNVLLGGEAGTGNSPSGNVTTANGIFCLGDAEITALYCQDTSISSSDSRDKTDITNFTHGLSWINKLNPVTYRWDKRSWYNEYNEDGSLKTEVTRDGSKKRARQHIGFLAQDVLAVEQADGFASKKDDMLVVNLNEDDTAYGLKYERLVPVLVNAIKELSTEVNTLKTKVAALEA